MTDEERQDIRKRCDSLVARMPDVLMFDEWARNMDNAKTDEQLLDVSERLVKVVNAYSQYRCIDIPSRPPFTWD